MNTHTYIHTYIHNYIPTYIHTYRHTDIQTYRQTYIHTYTHPHTYIHTDIHTHTYIGSRSRLKSKDGACLALRVLKKKALTTETGANAYDYVVLRAGEDEKVLCGMQGMPAKLVLGR